MVTRQLRKSSLKVLGYKFISGRSCLESVVENDLRRYPLDAEISLVIYTNQGNLHVVTAPGFVFDGRSGPKIIDWYAPNLGTLEERLAWYVHDCNGYGLDLGFEDTNVLLFVMLRDLVHYRNAKANVIQLAVSLSRSWYGTPKPDEWCYANMGKVRTLWMPKDVEA